MLAIPMTSLASQDDELVLENQLRCTSDCVEVELVVKSEL